MSNLSINDSELEDIPLSKVHSENNSWCDSMESILTQKIAKITTSETLFHHSTKYNPDFTFSELQLREAHLKNLKPKPSKCQALREKCGCSLAVHAKVQLRDEFELLKINLSTPDKAITLGESYGFVKETKGRKSRRLTWSMKKPHFQLQKFKSKKVRDLLIEIDESELAKTDAVIWKFLKRGPSFRKDYITARTFFLDFQDLHFPGFGSSLNSRFQNAESIRITCPNCGFFVNTRTKKITSASTKLTSLILAIVGLCFIPPLIYAFKDTVHLCPLCKIYLGFCPAVGLRRGRTIFSLCRSSQEERSLSLSNLSSVRTMVSASSTSAKNLFVESKLRLSDRVQVNVNNIAAITKQIQRGSKANENIIAAAKSFALQEAAIENSESNLKKLKVLSTHMHNQLDSLHNNSAKIELVLEQVRSMQR